MATQTTSPARTSTPRLLRRTLQANGIFSSASGIALIAGAVPITSFLGLGSPLILLVIGALLLLTGWVPFTAAGKWSVGLAALVVSAFAGLQIYGAWRAR